MAVSTLRTTVGLASIHSDGARQQVAPTDTCAARDIGHAGAMLQAKLLGSYLVVGVHSDEEILENKGPTVMSLRERCVFVSHYFSSPCIPSSTSTAALMLPHALH